MDNGNFKEHYRRAQIFSLILFCFSLNAVKSTKCSNMSALNFTWNEPPVNEPSVPGIVIIGEWWPIDCRVKTINANVNATLLKGGSSGNINKQKKVKDIDQKKVVTVKHNFFKILILRSNDGGTYYCDVCGAQKFAGEINIIGGDYVPFAQPTISKIPNKPVYRYGSSVKITCIGPLFYRIKLCKIVHSGLKGVELTTKMFRKKNLLVREYTIPRLTSRNEGTYLCEIKRKIVGYVANDTTTIKIQDTTAPSFSRFIESETIIATENENVSFSYTVQGNPTPVTTWFLENVGKMKQLYVCNLKTCQMIAERNGNVFITNTTFTINNVQYPRDNNVSYKCHISNEFGNASEWFVLLVRSKPHITPIIDKLTYSTGMQINCTVWKSNPTQVNFTWESCDPDQSTCDDKENGMWKVIQRTYSYGLTGYQDSFLILKQNKRKMVYRCTAQNIVGEDHVRVEVFNNEDPLQQGQRLSRHHLQLWTISVVLGAVALGVTLCVCVVLYKRRKIYGGFYIFSYPPLPDYLNNLNSNLDIKQLQKLPYFAEWEFPRENITLDSEIGKGEFGKVWLARATGISRFRPRHILKEKSNKSRLLVLCRRFRNRLRNTELNNNNSKEVTFVAVKMVKEDWDRSNLLDLKSEIKLLIHVGEHDNIVNILGACTNKGTSENQWMILEYCPYGDLRTFLQKKRESYEPGNFQMADPSQKLAHFNLVQFALQIARGMEFLTFRKVIHRDLAARNVLIGKRYVAKIADFGLARNIYKYQTYVKQSSTAVPLKWMAIESIRYSLYTERSDVWSFGILLWEIFALGETPYTGIPAVDVFKILMKGKRMDPPISSPRQISQIMKNCWETDPDDRPTFQSIVEKLEEYIINEGHFKTLLPMSEMEIEAEVKLSACPDGGYTYQNNACFSHNQKHHI